MPQRVPWYQAILAFLVATVGTLVLVGDAVDGISALRATITPRVSTWGTLILTATYALLVTATRRVKVRWLVRTQGTSTMATLVGVGPRAKAALVGLLAALWIPYAIPSRTGDDEAAPPLPERLPTQVASGVLTGARIPCPKHISVEASESLSRPCIYTEFPVPSGNFEVEVATTEATLRRLIILRVGIPSQDAGPIRGPGHLVNSPVKKDTALKAYFCDTPSEGRGALAVWSYEAVDSNELSITGRVLLEGVRYCP